MRAAGKKDPAIKEKCFEIANTALTKALVQKVRQREFQEFGESDSSLAGDQRVQGVVASEPVRLRGPRAQRQILFPF